jgi:ketosteroid isomerase-like protein
MYATIVAGNVRSAWKHINARDIKYVLQQFASKFRYEFFGNHALSGIRHRQDSMQKFFERIFVVFPDSQFEILNVLVQGPPWNTTVVAHVRVRATLENAQLYENQIFQRIRIQWGRIVEILTLEDTQKLVQALQVQLEAGILEAGAAPITDEQNQTV